MPETPNRIHSPSDSTYSEDVTGWIVRMTPEESEETTRYAVTLTLNIEAMYRRSKTGILEHAQKVKFASDTFAAFRWKLDRLVLKSAAARHGRELIYIPVLEGQNRSDRLHYHCVIVAPSWVALSDMRSAVRKAWERSGFGYQQIDVQPMRDEGWLSYMSKEAWTPRRDVVDLDNVRLSTDPKRC